MKRIKVVEATQIKIIVCTASQYRNAVGVHLNCPDWHYLNDALQVAERDMFPAVYCHYEVVGCTNYVIPRDVLNAFVSLDETAYPVKFEHAARSI